MKCNTVKTIAPWSPVLLFKSIVTFTYRKNKTINLLKTQIMILELQLFEFEFEEEILVLGFVHFDTVE